MAGLDPDRVRRNLDEVRAQLPDPDIAILAAVKYLGADDLPALYEGGIRVVGENRAQALEEKRAAAAGADFTWDFIGHLQSRKVKAVLPLVRWIHSVGSDSALKELGRHGTEQTEVLVEVNIAGEEGKSGIAPEALGAFIERCPVTVVGLMTMPPLAEDPEDSRRWFAALAQLAADHGLRELSMGTTQDFAVAAQEGATIIRIGTRLYA
ncbi:MAG: dependent protein [Solirubrobacteraceae bacterium]|jgi:pyridoxal phosphate enzyme (YggS family)|nr:dependent protein [Solirubrobacteraceae bacterium]